MPVRINLKELFGSDAQTIFTDKINYNFNKIIELGVGVQGQRGITGPGGSAGPQGNTGGTGQRGNKWFVGSGTPVGQTFPGIIDGDFYLDTDTSSIWQYTAATDTWTEITDISQIIINLIDQIGSPFIRGLGEASPLDDRYILFPHRGNNTIARTDDTILGNDSTNDMLLLSNWNETFIAVENFPVDTDELFNSLQNISVDHSLLGAVGRYHLEFSSVYSDTTVSPAEIKLSELNNNLKIRYFKDDVSSLPIFPNSNHFINTGRFSLSFPESGVMTDIDSNSLFEFITNKYNDEGAGTQREQLSFKMGSIEAIGEYLPTTIAQVDGLQISNGTESIALGIYEPSPTFKWGTISISPSLSGMGIDASGKNFQTLSDVATTTATTLVKLEAPSIHEHATNDIWLRSFNSNVQIDAPNGKLVVINPESINFGISRKIGDELDEITTGANAGAVIQTHHQSGICTDGSMVIRVAGFDTTVTGTDGAQYDDQGFWYGYDISHSSDRLNAMTIFPTGNSLYDSALIQPEITDNHGISLSAERAWYEQGGGPGLPPIYISFPLTCVRDVCIAGKYIYMVGGRPGELVPPGGTEVPNKANLSIVEFDSNVNRTQGVGFLEHTQALWDAHRIQVSGDFVFILEYQLMSGATSTSISFSSVWVGNPLDPDLKSRVQPNATGAVVGEIYGLDFDIEGEEAYVLSFDENVGGVAGAWELRMHSIDIHDPYGINFIDGGPTYPGGAGVGWVVNSNPTVNYNEIRGAIHVNQNKAYMVFNKSLYVANLNNTHNFLAGTQGFAWSGFDELDLTTFALSGTPSEFSVCDVIVNDDYIYILGSYRDTEEGTLLTLQMKDMSPTGVPVIISETTGSPSFLNPSKMTMSGQYIYIACSDHSGGGGIGNNTTKIKVNGLSSPGANIGSLTTTKLNVSKNASISNNLNVGNAVNVGSGGVYIDKGRGLTIDTTNGSIRMPHNDGGLETMIVIHNENDTINYTGSAIASSGNHTGYAIGSTVLLTPTGVAGIGTAIQGFIIGEWDGGITGLDLHLNGTINSGGITGIKEHIGFAMNVSGDSRLLHLETGGLTSFDDDLYGIHVDTSGGIVTGNSYGIYIEGEDYNYMQGGLSVGLDIPTTVSPIGNIIRAVGSVDNYTMKIENQNSGVVTSGGGGLWIDCNLMQPFDGTHATYPLIVQANLYPNGVGSYVAGSVLGHDDIFSVRSDGSVWIGGNNGGAVGPANVSQVMVRFDNNWMQLVEIGGPITSSLVVSDIDYKINVKALTPAVENILKLNPISFEWNEKFKDYNLKGSGLVKPESDCSDEDRNNYEKARDRIQEPTKGTQIGFIAQEIEKIIPEAVSGEDGNKKINYNSIVSYLVKGVQEQQKTIEQLQSKLENIEKKLNL